MAFAILCPDASSKRPWQSTQTSTWGPTAARTAAIWATIRSSSGRLTLQL